MHIVKFIVARRIKFHDWPVLYHVPLWWVENKEAVLPKETVSMCVWDEGVLFLESKVIRKAERQSNSCLTTSAM